LAVHGRLNVGDFRAMRCNRILAAPVVNACFAVNAVMWVWMWWVLVSGLVGGSGAAESVIVRVGWFQIDASVDVT